MLATWSGQSLTPSEPGFAHAASGAPRTQQTGSSPRRSANCSCGSCRCSGPTSPPGPRQPWALRSHLVPPFTRGPARSPPPSSLSPNPVQGTHPRPLPGPLPSALDPSLLFLLGPCQASPATDFRAQRPVMLCSAPQPALASRCPQGRGVKCSVISFPVGHKARLPEWEGFEEPPLESCLCSTTCIQVACCVFPAGEMSSEKYTASARWCIWPAILTGRAGEPRADAALPRLRGWTGLPAPSLALYSLSLRNSQLHILRI